MADIKLPIIGETKPAVVIIGAVVIAGGIWLYYRHEQNAAASSAAPGTSSTDDGSQIDPATGYPYGSAQDEQALAEQSASGSGAYGGYDETGSDIDPATGFVTGSPQDLAALQQLYGTGTTTSTVPTTNAQWAQDVQSTLTAIGYNGHNVSVAVGLYLGRKALDANQQEIIQTALAEVGPPPSGSYTIIAAKPKPSKPGHQVKEYTTGGDRSLNALAKSWHNTAEEVVLLTDANGGQQAKWRAYEKTHKFDAKVPAGIHLYYEVKG
jgi:hypothetical protein